MHLNQCTQSAKDHQSAWCNNFRSRLPARGTYLYIGNLGAVSSPLVGRNGSLRLKPQTIATKALNSVVEQRSFAPLDTGTSHHVQFQNSERPNLYDSHGRLVIKSLTLPELQRWFAARGERPNRGDQMWRWVYTRGLALLEGAREGGREAADAEGWNGDGFSAAFIDKFSLLLSLDGGLALRDVTTASDGTRKLVFAVTGGEAAGGRIETVLIPWYRDYDPRVSRRERPRYTLCVSSQVGCAMNCQFCFTGRRGLLGNLSTAQIVEQVLVAQQLLEAEAQAATSATAAAPTAATPSSSSPPAYPSSASASAIPSSSTAMATAFVSPPSPSPSPPAPPASAPITNIVFMGMGEPLHNPEAVFGAIDILTHRRAFGMSASRITLSTVGLLPQLQHFLDRYAPAPSPAAPATGRSPHATTTSPSSTPPPIIPTSAANLESSFTRPSAASPTPHTSNHTSATSTSGARDSGSSGSRGRGSRDWDRGRTRDRARDPDSSVPRVSLAVSIHAGTDTLRTAIVPSNSCLTLLPGREPWSGPDAGAGSGLVSGLELIAPLDESLATTSRASASGPFSPGSLSPLSSCGSGSSTFEPVTPSAAASGTGRPASDVVNGGSQVSGDSVNGSGGGGSGASGLRGLAALCAVLTRHYPRTDRRPLRAGRYVLFEYTMLGGVNDRPEDARALLEATAHIECSYNLIMFNPFPGTVYRPSTPERVAEFQRVLREQGGRIVHVRKSKGDSDMAACGQLGDVGPLALEVQASRQASTAAVKGGAGGEVAEMPATAAASGAVGRRRGGARMLPEALALAAAAAESAGGQGPAA